MTNDGMPIVAITGAAGFVGSHLVDRYLERGHRVVGVDNFITGDARNLAAAGSRREFAFVEADLSAPGGGLAERLAAPFGAPGLVLHFASPASPADYANLPLQTLAVNSRGTEFCARAALQWDAGMLYASTSEAYGDPLEHPQRETYWGNVNPVGVRSCYDEAKRFGEALVSAFVRAHGLHGRIVRIFNTYGPRMRANDGRVVPNFVMQALRGEPLTIYGDGRQTRSFCYVDDLVTGIVACAASPETRGRVVNLGNPDERTIAAFAAAVCSAAGVALRSVEAPMPADDPGRRCPDITVARELLGWEPRVSLEEGLRRTVAWFREPDRRAGDEKTGGISSAGSS